MNRVAALTLFLALPASAAYYPVFNTNDVRLHVGETETVWVTPRWSGIAGPYSYHWHFSSNRPEIAMADAIVESGGPLSIDILAVAPGVASLRLGQGDWPFVGIIVTCAPEPPVLAATPTQRVSLGDTVDLVATSPIAHRTVFTWYHGRIGDTSRPIDNKGPGLTFTPPTRGTHYVWVQATTTCAASSAEFRIDSDIPKKRAVRR